MSLTSKKLESLLSQRHVFIKHPEVVREKIARLIKDGPSALQVVSDFDKTISKHRYLGKKCDSSYCVIEKDSLMPDEIKKELEQMGEKYFAIEVDHNLTNEEKTPHMVEWCQKGVKLFCQAKVNKTSITRMVEESNVRLRDGFTEMVKDLNKQDVPLLIFSAGVGDVLKEVILQQSEMLPNIKIVANFMDFDQNGSLVGLKGTLIHPFNKNESVLQDDRNYFKKIQHRHNVILMGDLMGDLSMADGVPDQNICLKIGFLNSNFQTLLEPFMDGWDIVLEDEQTMDIPKAVVEAILD